MMFVYLLPSHIYVEETSNNLTFPSGLTDGHGFSSPSHDSKSCSRCVAGVSVVSS